MRTRVLFLTAAIAALVATTPAPMALAQATWYGWTTTPFTCRVVAVTVTTECQALTNGLRAYIVDATFTNGTAGAQTIKLTTGTGTNCGTGQADLTHAVQFGAAVGQWDHSWAMPLKPAATGLAVCITPSAATSISGTLTGFLAP